MQRSLLLVSFALGCAAPPGASTGSGPSSQPAVASAQEPTASAFHGFVSAGPEVFDLSTREVFAHGLVARNEPVSFVLSFRDQSNELLLASTTAGLVGYDMRARRERWRAPHDCAAAWLRSDEVFCALSNGGMVALAAASGTGKGTWSVPSLELNPPSAAYRFGDDWVVANPGGLYRLRRGGAFSKADLGNQYVAEVAVTTESYCARHYQEPAKSGAPVSVSCFGADGTMRWSRTFRGAFAIQPQPASDLLLVWTHSLGSVDVEGLLTKTGKRPEPPLGDLRGIQRLFSDEHGAPVAALTIVGEHRLGFQSIHAGATARQLTLVTDTPERVVSSYLRPLLVVSDPIANPTVTLVDVTKEGDSGVVVPLPRPSTGEQSQDVDGIEIMGPYVIVHGTAGNWRLGRIAHVIDRKTGEVIRSLPTTRFGQTPAAPSPR